MTTGKTEKAEKLFMTAEWIATAAAVEQFPAGKIPEVAFAGRSNVGKSSLINALTNRKNLARSSNTPGRTQQIFFYGLGARLTLVDLPGYGHATAPRTEKERWNELTRHYLQTRSNLRCVCLLIDSRHGALAGDLAMMRFLDRTGTGYKIVLTKLDQVKSAERGTRQGQIAAMLEKHPAARAGVIVTSAAKATGIEEVREFLAAFAL